MFLVKTIQGVVDAKGPVEGIAVMNEYGEYFYDAFLENIDKYEFNKILNVGNKIFFYWPKMHFSCALEFVKILQKKISSS